ncbi:MAG: hypothetical protein Ct9H300mP18_08710 [Candidatus Neomarinimicrobiota bacterium]|nr:MAG: hypothetical protein Ct9H300mP18_08710 [Candidatus Neomarinimicrobiota bacterium]
MEYWQVLEGEGRIYKESFPTMYHFGSTFNFQQIYIVGDIGIVAKQEEVLGTKLRLGGEYLFLKNIYSRRVW